MVKYFHSKMKPETDMCKKRAHLIEGIKTSQTFGPSLECGGGRAAEMEIGDLWEVLSVKGFG